MLRQATDVICFPRKQPQRREVQYRFVNRLEQRAHMHKCTRETVIAGRVLGGVRDIQQQFEGYDSLQPLKTPQCAPSTFKTRNKSIYLPGYRIFSACSALELFFHLNPAMMNCVVECVVLQIKCDAGRNYRFIQFLKYIMDSHKVSK